MGFVVDNHSPDREAWVDWLTSIDIDPSNVRSVEVNTPTSLCVAQFMRDAAGNPVIAPSGTELRVVIQTIELAEPIPSALGLNPF